MSGTGPAELGPDNDCAPIHQALCTGEDNRRFEPVVRLARKLSESVSF